MENSKEILELLEYNYNKISQNIQSIEVIDTNQLVLSLQEIINKSNNHNYIINSWFDKKFYEDKNIFIEQFQNYHSIISFNFNELNLISYPSKNYN